MPTSNVIPVRLRARPAWGASMFLAAAAVVAGASIASAATLYDSTTSTRPNYVNPFGPAPMLDDVQLVLPAGAPPTQLTQVRFGARNADSSPAAVDLLLSFFDDVNAGATGSTVVESNLIGTVRLSGIVVPADGTATFTLPVTSSLILPDSTAGVRLSFVEPLTSTVNENVDALLTPDLPSVGATVDRYWTDQGVFNQTFVGNEAVEPDLTVNPPVHANVFLRLEGVAVPEPGVAALASAALLGGLARRRRRTV